MQAAPTMQALSSIRLLLLADLEGSSSRSMVNG